MKVITLGISLLMELKMVLAEDGSTSLSFILNASNNIFSSSAGLTNLKATFSIMSGTDVGWLASFTKL